MFWNFYLIYLPVIASSWVDDLFAFFLIGSILGSISTEGHRHRCEQESLVSGVEKIYMVREDSIVYLALLLPAVAWISGRDPLLVVSVVMSRGFLQIRFLIIFLFASS